VHVLNVLASDVMLERKLVQNSRFGAKKVIKEFARIYWYSITANIVLQRSYMGR